MLPYQNRFPDHLPNERWEPVTGYHGDYSISSLGRVFSSKTRIMLRQQVKVSKRGSQRLKVNLSVRGIVTPEWVVQLVGKAFIGNLKDGEVYAHINKDPLDNRLENIKILTYLESAQLAKSLKKGPWSKSK